MTIIYCNECNDELYNSRDERRGQASIIINNDSREEVEVCISCFDEIQNGDFSKKEVDSLELIAEYIRAEVYKSGDYEDDSVHLASLERVINKIKESK